MHKINKKAQNKQKSHINSTRKTKNSFKFNKITTNSAENRRKIIKNKIKHQKTSKNNKKQQKTTKKQPKNTKKLLKNWKILSKR